MFYQGLVILIVYVDDGMFLGKSEHQLSNIVKEFKDIGLDIQDQWHPTEYVGVNIWKHDDGSSEFTQCAIIDSIIEDIGLYYAKAETNSLPAAAQMPLHAFNDSHYFNYLSIVSKLNEIVQTMQPEADPCKGVWRINCVFGWVVDEDLSLRD